MLLNICRNAALAAVLAVLPLALPACSEDSTVPEAEKVNLEMVGQAEILQKINAAEGKVVLLNFWATWCEPCRAEIKHLKELRDEYGEDELLILGVSVDRNVDTASSFAGRVGFNYPVFVATDSATQFFRVAAVPRLLIYDTRGALKINAEGLVSTSKLREVIDKFLAG
jgi:thiol-disulfide isomerase/thioredoxin